MTTADALPQRASIWWVFLLQGIAGILLGVMLLTAPGATLLALTTFLVHFHRSSCAMGLPMVR